jgi:hypothetical protein
MAAALGETTNPKELIPGEPELIANDLRELVRTLRQVDGVGNDLGKIDPVQWTGDASTVFRSAFGAEPPRWQQAAESLGQGGQALADFGDVLSWGQREAQRAIELYHQAQAASRAAAAQYDAQVLAAPAGGSVPPFQDPGQAAAQNAQAILDNARKAVEAVGDQVSRAFGFESDGKGGYKKSLGDDREFGADKRGADGPRWQRGKRSGSYEGEWGSQSGGLLTDRIGDTLEKLGIDLPEKTWTASADAALLSGELKGEFESGPFSGHGKLDGSLLGVGAEASASAGPLGVTVAASAEAYLAKGSAEGEVKLGDHAGVSGSAEGMIGAKAEAQGTVGWLGAQGSVDAFAGAKVSAEGSAEVAGIGAGVHGEAWAGVGAHASGQFGMGDDGKFHVGASLGVAVGVGGKVGFDVSVDPGEVVDTVKDVADDVGEIAGDVGRGVGNAAKGVGHLLGF